MASRQLTCFRKNSRSVLWPAEKKLPNWIPMRGFGASSTLEITPHKETSRFSLSRSNVTSTVLLRPSSRVSVSTYIPPQLTFNATAGINFPWCLSVTGRSVTTRSCLLFSITPSLLYPAVTRCKGFQPFYRLLLKKVARIILSCLHFL